VWVFDDEFCIIGSANINNRGMTHDSEIAVGIYQPDEGGKKSGFARSLRIALWTRFFEGDARKGFDDPMAGIAAWKEVRQRKRAANAQVYDWERDPRYRPESSDPRKAGLDVIDPRINPPGGIQLVNPNPGKRRIDYDIRFAVDKDEPLPDSAPALEKLAARLAGDEQLRFVIEGHTDATGTGQHNLELSVRRSKKIVDWLTKHGVKPSQVSARGCGELFPIAGNKNEKDRALNRRVEVLPFRNPGTSP
jgi:outer membrane protein OmpA-like peptidoglycan-associated protein